MAKKVKEILFCFLTIVTLAGCSKDIETVGDAIDWSIDWFSQRADRAVKSVEQDKKDVEILKEKAKEVIRCFDESDVDGLANLYPLYDEDNEVELKKLIQEAFEVYEGKSLSYDFSYLGFDGCIYNGVWEDKHTYVRMRKIKTDSNKTYNMEFVFYMDYEEGVNIHRRSDVQPGILGMSVYDENFKNLAGIGIRD